MTESKACEHLQWVPDGVQTVSEQHSGKWRTVVVRRMRCANPQCHKVELRPSNQDVPLDSAREQAAWDTELLEYTHDAIIMWEMNGNGIRYWNRSAEQLYGYSRQEAHGRITHELLKTRLAGGVSHLERAVARYGIWVGELEHTTRDGRQVQVEARLALMSQHSGRWLVLEVNRDITDRKAAEANRAVIERQMRGLREVQR